MRSASADATFWSDLHGATSSDTYKPRSRSCSRTASVAPLEMLNDFNAASVASCTCSALDLSFFSCCTATRRSVFMASSCFCSWPCRRSTRSSMAFFSSCHSVSLSTTFRLSRNCGVGSLACALAVFSFRSSCRHISCSARSLTLNLRSSSALPLSSCCTSVRVLCMRTRTASILLWCARSRCSNSAKSRLYRLFSRTRVLFSCRSSTACLSSTTISLAMDFSWMAASPRFSAARARTKSFRRNSRTSSCVEGERERDRGRWDKANEVERHGDIQWGG